MNVEWIDVKKDLPDDGICVLIALSDGESWTGYYEGGEWFYTSADKIEDGTVVYWMHFPDAPEAA